MKAIFKGYSDDIVYVEGVPGSDEFYGGRGDIFTTFLLAGPGGSVKVHAIYDGCWSFAVAQVAEGVPIPEWQMTLTHEMIREEIGYSTVLTIEVPDGTAVAQMKR